MPLDAPVTSAVVRDSCLDPFILSILPYLPHNSQKVDHVPPWTDVAFLTLIDGLDGHPTQLETQMQANCHHLNLKFKTPFRAFQHGLHDRTGDQSVSRLIVAHRLS